MAPIAADRLPTGPGWSLEPKRDGVRACCETADTPQGVRLQSRQLRPRSPRGTNRRVCYPNSVSVDQQTKDYVIALGGLTMRQAS
jgi:hypothetical protein